MNADSSLRSPTCERSDSCFCFLLAAVLLAGRFFVTADFFVEDLLVAMQLVYTACACGEHYLQ